MAFTARVCLLVQEPQVSGSYCIYFVISFRWVPQCHLLRVTLYKIAHWLPYATHCASVLVLHRTCCYLTFYSIFIQLLIPLLCTSQQLVSPSQGHWHPASPQNISTSNFTNICYSPSSLILAGNTLALGEFDKLESVDSGTKGTPPCLLIDWLPCQERVS